MKGMDTLTAERIKGRSPSLVMVDLDDASPRFVRLTQPMRDPKGKPMEGPRQVPQVFVDPAESVRRLDLRPLIGLQVLAMGHDSERLRAFREAAIAHNVSRVVTYDYTADTWTDTDGHFVS